MRGEGTEAQMEGRRSFGPMTRRDIEREEIFGDRKREQVPEDIIRIEGLNLNTMPITDDIRMEGLRNWAINNQATIIPTTETNRDWSRIHPDKHPEQIMTGWWKQVSINKTWLKDNENKKHKKYIDDRRKRRYGGVALITNNRLASTISAQGRDRLLGRWVWTTYRGKNNYRTTVICLYYPHDNVKSEGTVYMQQATALELEHPGEQREPHSEYLKDLRHLLEDKISKGENILVTGDFNQNIQKWNAPVIQLLNQLGLKELIADRHNNCQLPPTFDGGSYAIDGLFGSSVFQIQAGGYSAFGMNILSNHRAYWADIPIRQILGGGLETVVRPKGRRLQTHIPKIKARYNLIVNTEIIKRKLVPRLQQLYKEVRSTKSMTTSQRNRFNGMVYEQKRCIQIGERNCTKLRRGDIPYSKEVHDAMGRVVCWGLIVQRESMKGKKNRPHAKLLRQRIRRWNFNAKYKGMTLKAMKKELKAADKAWRKIKPTALEKRDEFLSQLAIDKSMVDGIKPESHLKQLRNLEQVRKLFRRIKNATRKNIGGAASYIEEVQNDGSRKQITEQGPMEKGIKRANTEKLQQVNNVDMRKEPLQSHFGEQGDTAKWEEIHNGNLQLPADYPAEKGLRLFMDEISKNHLPPIDIVPDDEEYNKSWKKMREKTSCAPPLHFGHFIAPDEGTPSSLVNTMIGTIPIMTGEIPEAWKECVNTMLVKKINDMRPEKLRLVTLLQPQYLHASKLANKKMMAHAEHYCALAAEQYGSRKKKNSRTHCLNKRLVYDLTRIQHAIMVLIANDLKSCYDRILMLIAYETMRHLGLSEQVAICLTVCMLEMKHRIRTIYGDSEDYYGGDKWEGGIKPAGNGQGNGNGPGLWAGISSICLDIMRREGYGREMESAISGVAIMLTGFAFVDDTDLIQVGRSAEEAMEKAQDGLILWEQLMRATGGALEPSKSDWVMVNYQRSGNKWRLEQKDVRRELRVRGPDDTVKPLTQLQPTEARETLGIWQSPDGNEDKQTSQLKKSVEEWCMGMQSHCLPARDVEIGIRTTIGRKIHYCLVATCLTKKQCKEIIDPVIRRVMPKMRLSRNTPRIVVHAPTELLGIGIDDPFFSQIVEHVKAISDVGGTEKHTGIILTNIIEDHLLEAGRSNQIFSWDMKSTGIILTDTWLKFTITIMQEHGIHIKSNHKELDLWREKDEHIMERAFAFTQGTGVLSADQIKSINTCRKYLNATTVSDISNGYGTHILDDAYHCNLRFTCSSSEAYTWPRQLPPTQRDIMVWKTFLQTLTSRGTRLRQRLGRWKQEAKKWHKWRFHQEYDRVYQKTDHGWKIWIPARISKRTRRRQYYNSNRIASIEEIEASNIAVISQGRVGSNKIILQGYGGESPITNPIMGTTIEDIRQNGWAISQIQIHDEQRIIDMIKLGNGKGGSDGSYNDGKSTSAFNIFDGSSDLLEGGNYVPGPSKDQTSYRAELGGILGLIICVNVLCERHNITDGIFTLGCDNDSALQTAFDDWEVQCTSSCFDIIRMIRYQLKRSPIRWKTKKVKGHQDKTKQYSELDIWAQSNVRADTLAGEIMSTHPTHIHQADPKGAGWTIELNGTRVIANTSRELYTHVTSRPIKQYWAEKNYIDTMEYDTDTLDAAIYWEGMKSMSKMIPGYQRRWITKHMAHISPTNFQMGPARRKQRDTDKCPMCESVETTDHVYRCSSEISTNAFEEKYAKLDNWLHKHSPSDLSKAILEILLAIREDREPLENELWSEAVIHAFRAQCDMSPLALTHGLMHSDWIPIQKEHAIRNKAKMKVCNWAGHVIRMIWDIQWTIWQARTEFLHSTEEARKKILATNADQEIDDLFRNMPNNTWMTKAQRAYLTIPKRVVKKYKARRKIRWLRKAKIIKKGYEDYLAKCQNSASAQLLRNYIGYGQNQEDEKTTDHTSGNDSDSTNMEAPRELRQSRITEWIRAGQIDNG